ncbi:hypothetical protein ACFL2J_03485 [Candidatus Omnitrophota bacterium]
MHKRLLLTVLLFSIIFFASPCLYALTILSGLDTDGCYVIRVEGRDIISDVSIISDLSVSRDNGKNWEVVLRDANKRVNWFKAGGTSIITKVTLPAGHYNAVRIKSHRTIKANLENREGRPRREFEFDLGGEMEFVISAIDMLLEKDGNISLRLDNPLAYLDLRVKWDTKANAYAEPQVIDQVFKKDTTGSVFTIEQIFAED